MKKTAIFPLFILAGLSLTACGDEGFSLKIGKGEQLIHQEHQEAYLLDSNPDNIGKYAAYAELENYANPKPVEIFWSNRYDKTCKCIPFNVFISEKEDFSDAYVVPSFNNYLKLYNCKINTEYYVKVENTYKEECVSSFTTSPTSLRNIYVEGVDNFRDLGGYKTSDGKTVKQGLVYRSAEFNKNKQTSLVTLITEDGIDAVTNQLKIKTEVDLRKGFDVDGVVETSGITESPISKDIKYLNYPMYYDGDNILNHSVSSKKSINDKSIKQFFELLADKSNLPVVFHCAQGKDRTGALAYLLNMILGVSKVDLARDYLFTNFSKSVGSACKLSDIENRYFANINKAEGSSLKEKAFNFAKTQYGLTDETLNSVINNLVE